MFNNWRKHKKCDINRSILWEYDTKSPEWNWNYMKEVVVQRVLENGRPDDYYAMLQLYGGKRKVRDIIKSIPHLQPREMNWACVLFNLKKEDLRCCTRKSLRRKLLNS